MKDNSSFKITTKFSIVCYYLNRMLIVNPIIRNPRQSEMSLSSQVKESVDQAAGSLREALAFAARTEHPIVISTLTDILVRLESLEQMEEFMDKFGKPKDIPTNFG